MVYVRAENAPEAELHRGPARGQQARSGLPVRVSAKFGEYFTVTAVNLRREPNAGFFFGPEICADVTYLNRADASSNYSQFDWKLQTPAGVVQSFALTTANLGTGQLVPGGTKSGTVCFKDNGEVGQFVLIWKGSWFNADRGIWVVNLQ